MDEKFFTNAAPTTQQHLDPESALMLDQPTSASSRVSYENVTSNNLNQLVEQQNNGLSNYYNVNPIARHMSSGHVPSEEHEHHHHHHHQQQHHQEEYSPSHMLRSARIGTARSKSLSRQHQHHHSSSAHIKDELLILNICHKLGLPLDSAPPIPKSRPYTIMRDWKIGFPQKRRMNLDWYDGTGGIKIMRGEIIHVLGPSPNERGYFTIQYEGQLFEMPFRYTTLPLASDDDDVMFLHAQLHMSSTRARNGSSSAVAAAVGAGNNNNSNSRRRQLDEGDEFARLKIQDPTIV